jgi:hypothetical protein
MNGGVGGIGWRSTESPGSALCGGRGERRRVEQFRKRNILAVYGVATAAGVRAQLN